MNKFYKFILSLCFIFSLFVVPSYAYNTGSDYKILFPNGVILNGYGLQAGENALLLRNKTDHTDFYFCILDSGYFIRYDSETQKFYSTRLNNEELALYSNSTAHSSHGSYSTSQDRYFWGSWSGSTFNVSANSYEVFAYTGDTINYFETYTYQGTDYYKDTGIIFYSNNTGSDSIIRDISLSNGYVLKGVPYGDFAIVNRSTDLRNDYRYLYPWQPNYLLVQDQNDTIDFAYWINGAYYVGLNCRLNLDLEHKTFTTTDYPDNIKFDDVIRYRGSELVWYSTEIWDCTRTSDTITYEGVTLTRVVTNSVYSQENVIANSSVNYESDDLFTNIKNFFLHLFWPTKDEISQLKNIINNNPLMVNFVNIFTSLTNIPLTKNWYIDFGGWMGINVVNLTGSLFSVLTDNICLYIRRFTDLVIIFLTTWKALKILHIKGDNYDS